MNFIEFVKKERPDYLFPDFVVEVIDALEQLERGEIKRLAIFLPPRSGKTDVFSCLFSAWYLSRSAIKDVISSTYSMPAAISCADQVSRSMNPSLIDFFKIKRGFFKTIDGGRYQATGLYSAMGGLGADLMVLDDIEGLVSAIRRERQEDYRNKIWQWFINTPYQRLFVDGQILMLGTRSAENDIYARILNETEFENWVTIEVPAMCDGVSYWPERYSEERFSQIKNQIGELRWKYLYQQGLSD